MRTTQKIIIKLSNEIARAVKAKSSKTVCGHSSPMIGRWITGFVMMWQSYDAKKANASRGLILDQVRAK